MNGFERRKEQKKESIRRAALELFMQYGFKKVSISDIARKADVSPVTIYNHFGSKDGIVKEAVKLQMMDMIGKYKAIIDGEGTFPEKLEEIVFDKTDIAARFQGELAQVVFQDDPEMQSFVEAILPQGGLRMTLDLLEEGKREGYISEKLSEETLYVYLEILRRGITGSVDLMTRMKSYSDLVRELNKIFLYGLIGERKT